MRMIVCFTALCLLCEAAIPREALLAEIDPRVVKLLGGEAGLNAIRSAKEVYAFRMQQNEPGDSEEEPERIGGSYVTLGPIPVGKEDAARLAKLLADPTTYEWNSAKACDPQPGAALRFVGEKSTVELLLCFECNILEVLLNGKRVGSEDFDSQRGALVKVMQKSFPNDEVIQKLE